MSRELLIGLVIGLILGWLIEWIIDRYFLRRRLEVVERALEEKKDVSIRLSRFQKWIILKSSD